MRKLRGLLNKVDEVPLAAKSLAPPASAKHLEALARDVFRGALPAELRAWFAWHDGQRSLTELRSEALHEEAAGGHAAKPIRRTAI